MSDYKRYFLKQLGIKESTLKPAGIDPDDVNKDELEMGVDDEKEHTSDPNTAQTIALQHLKKDPNYYTQLKNAGLDETPSQSSILAPKIATPQIVSMAVRGSSTGGFPSGRDNITSPLTNGELNVSKMTSGQLGGYEPIPIYKDNSQLVNKTPINPSIDSTKLKDNCPSIDNITPHPYQIQNIEGEAPQKMTGASIDNDDSIALKVSMPNGIDINLEEHKNAKLNKTFKKHLRLMNETIKSKEISECDCSSDCKCDGCNNKKNNSDKQILDKVEEKYSEPFSKMRGLANLGERKLSKTGLWESPNKPGKDFITHWKMDKIKGGMVKIDEKKLSVIKEKLSKIPMLTEKQQKLLNLINKVSVNK